MLTFQPSEKILPVLPGVGDGASRVLATDVHVLDDLDLGVALDERLVGVVGAGRVVGRHQAVAAVLRNFASGMASVIPSMKPCIRPCAQFWVGSPPETAKFLKSRPLAFM